MNKRYIQIGEKWYNGKYKVIVARALDDNNQIDFDKGLEYFIKFLSRDYLDRPYRMVDLDVKRWFEEKRQSKLISDKKLLLDVIEQHRKYDIEHGYSTTILDNNARTVELNEGFFNLLWASFTAFAGYHHCYNSISVFYSNKGDLEKHISHEVGHMKLSKATLERNYLIVETGLSEEEYIIEDVVSTKEGDQLLLTSSKARLKIGIGIEESLNESEIMNIEGYSSCNHGFGIILDKILEEKAQQARHNMSRGELIEALNSLIPSKGRAQELILLLDEYFNQYIYNDSFDNRDEFILYNELSDYIIAKTIQDKKRGIFSKDFLDSVLNWDIKCKGNKEPLEQLQKRLRVNING